MTNLAQISYSAMPTLTWGLGFPPSWSHQTMKGSYCTAKRHWYFPFFKQHSGGYTVGHGCSQVGRVFACTCISRHARTCAITGTRTCTRAGAHAQVHSARARTHTHTHTVERRGRGQRRVLCLRAWVAAEPSPRTQTNTGRTNWSLLNVRHT